MRVVRIDSDGTVRDQQIRNSLNELRKIVDGDIECVTLNDALTLVLYVNDMGKIKGLPTNEKATTLYREYGNVGDWIAGNAVVCACNAGETCDLTDNQVGEIMKILLEDAPMIANVNKESECEEYKTVEYKIDHLDMSEFKQRYIRRGRYGEYICDKTHRSVAEVIKVKFKVKYTYEIFEELGAWWGGWNDCPDWRTMRDKAREWYVKYGAELKGISHDMLVFVCRKLSEEEAGVLWDDICQFAPNSRDIMDEDTIKECLWLHSEIVLWWD